MKILVIRFGSLGDVVLTTALLRSLKQRYPRSQVHFMLKARFAGVLGGHPCVDEVLALEKGGLRALLGRVRAEKYDLVFDLHGTARSRLLALASGARVFRASRQLWARRLEVWFKRLPPVPPRHVAARYLETLPPLPAAGFSAEDLMPSLAVEKSHLRWGDDFLKSRGFSRGEVLVAMAPGAAWKTKRWPARHFAAAASALSQKMRRNPRFLLIGDPGEAAACREVAAAMGASGKKAILAAGETSLDQLKALLSRCRLLLCNDSGPMHLAAGLGLPVVALFGPTVENFGFRPLGPRDVLLQLDLPCRPCSLHGSDDCPLGTHECLEGLAPALAVDAALSHLEAPWA